MDFEFYFIEQIKKHPSIMPRDVVKMCYQAAFGAEHLLMDVAAAKRYFDAEFASVNPRQGELFECLSDEICRVDLGAWKACGMPSEWLFRMFVASATTKQGSCERFLSYLSRVETCLTECNAAFSFDEWQDYLAEYKRSEMGAVHHSDRYRESEAPSYRVVNRRFLRVLPILQKAAELSCGTEARVIAIDGRAASGKTTLSSLLRVVLDAEVIHMDDFFLPPELRTKERLAEAGGNVHYERFLSEVISKVRSLIPFSYRIFDCGTMDYCGEREISASSWRVVEGSYSHHNELGQYADLRVFCTVSEEEQMQRIIARDGEKLAEMFRNRWIPMEEKYFETFDIEKKADIIIK